MEIENEKLLSIWEALNLIVQDLTITAQKDDANKSTYEGLIYIFTKLRDFIPFVDMYEGDKLRAWIHNELQAIVKVFL